jgi:cell division protease FtsH
MLPNADPVHKISIVARGMSLGHTRQLPVEDRYLMTRSQFKDVLATLLGGHVAEELVFSEVTTGSQNDIERATKLARAMVTDYGMSDKLGPRTFGHKEEMVFLGREISEQRDYSEEVARQIDDEVCKIIQQAYTAARKILTENNSKLVQIAEKLIAQETLEGEELEAAFNETSPRPARKKRKAAPVPVPVELVAEAGPAPRRVPKKTSPVPRLVPGQTPAASD